MYITSETGDLVYQGKRGKRAGFFSPSFKKPYRQGVVLVVANENNQILVAQPVKQPHLWILPQGGKNKGEGGIAAAFRELGEEFGLCTRDVKLLGSLGQVRFLFEDWQQYRQGKLRSHAGKYRGQEQEVFLFRLQPEAVMSLSGEGRTQEVLSTQWVSLSDIMAGLAPREPRVPVYRNLQKKIARHLAAH